MLSYDVLESKLKLAAKKMMELKSNGVKEKFPISLIDMNCWEWPQGVGLFGLYKYYRLSRDQEILSFLIRWFDERLKEGIFEKNVNTTAPMLTLTYLYEETGKQEYLELIREWSAWIMEDKKLIRTGDECFQHMITGDPNDGEILIDTIFMTLLFLGRAGKLLNQKSYTDEVNYQILNHIKYLFDKKKGLFYHGFNFIENHNYGEVYWNRGNSWYTVGLMELLADTDTDPAIRRYFLSVYKAQVKALKECADDESGLWHTILDDPQSYIEMSGSAAFLCGIMQGVRYGYLKREEYEGLIEKGMSHVLEYIGEDGTVLNVSYGTPIGYDKEHYRQIPCCPMTYGQALMILCLQEAMTDYWQ